MEVKGFDALDHPRRVMVEEKGPDDKVGLSLISPVGNSSVTRTNTDGTEDTGLDSHNQGQEDFSGVILGIKAMDQGNLNSNPNCPTGSMEVSNKEVLSTETTRQSIIDLKKSCEVSLEPKDTELISTDIQKFSFDVGWVEKSPMREGGPTKIRGKGKGKLTGLSFISAQTMMDHD